MGRPADILAKMRNSAANVRFADLCAVVEALGYTFDRQSGSHRIYQCEGLRTINLQPGQSGKAKPYQVRQVLEIIDANGLKVR
jgi:predicted RNA binding protein YcfA (HicA-like mRNA interferase family)